MGTSITRDRKPRSLAALAMAVLACCTSAPHHSAAAAEAARPLDAAERRVVVRAIGELLASLYVDEKVARRTARHLETVLAAGRLEERDPARFALRLTEELQRASRDRHVEVKLAPPQAAPTPAAPGDWREGLRRRAYDVRRVERLSGGVGYLDLRSFPPLDPARTAAEAAMTLLASGDAVILDLRRNSGGTGEMVTLLAGYFLPPRTHLATTIKRSRNERRETWTRDDVLTTRLRELPLYLLTSAATFSAAESFAYELQARRRAVVVGETTRGGANSGGYEPLGERFLLFVPDVQVVSAATKSNWEGVGVVPDVRVKADSALAAAHRAAVERLRGEAKDEVRRRELDWALAALAAEGGGRALPAHALEGYGVAMASAKSRCGPESFGCGATVGCGPVCFRLARTDSYSPGVDGVELRFERGRGGGVVAMRLRYADGDEERTERARL